MTNKELNEILEEHEKWFRGEFGGKRANLSCLNLTNANLKGANLGSANLSNVILRNANLRHANLVCTDLVGASFVGANLSNVNFKSADLRGADLRDTNLINANIEDANLKHADLRGAQNVPFIPLACPDTGSFIGWKKARLTDCVIPWCIVKLEICEDAKRSSATTNKCRASKVKVLGFETLDGVPLPDDFHVVSDFDSSFVYKVNTVIEIENFDEDRWYECAPGIHFFINRQEAVNYI